MENISTKVISAGFWSLGSHWLSRGLGLLKIVILARLLSPLDFGILGLATFVLNILNVSSDIGIESALIQKDKIGREELDATWTLSILRGVLLFVLLFVGGGWIASYYGNATLKPVLKIMAVTFLLAGGTNVGIVFFQKELALKKKAILELAADIGGTIATIGFAFWLRNVWALVAGTIFWGLIKCLCSYRLHNYRPRLFWNWPIAKSFLGFGKYIFWIGVMTFIVTNADNALVGKLLGLTLLGFYAMAFNISSIPFSSVSGVLSQVFFPAYAKIQYDRVRLNEAFRKTFEAVMVILLPLTSVMIVLAPGFTTLFLGKKWIPIIPALQGLCFWGLFRGVSSLFYPLHLALNRPDIQAKIKSFDLLTFIVCVYPLTVHWGIFGTSCAMALVYLINMIMNMALTIRLIPLPWKKLGYSVIVPLVMSLAIVIAAILIQSLKSPFGEIAKFISIVISSAGIVILLAVIYRRRLLTDIIDAIKLSL